MHNFLCFFFNYGILFLSNFLKACFQILIHLYFFLPWPLSLKIFFISSGNYTSFLKNWSIWLFILRTYYFLSIHMIILPLLLKTFFTITDWKTKIVLIKVHLLILSQSTLPGSQSEQYFSRPLVKTALISCH